MTRDAVRFNRTGYVMRRANWKVLGINLLMACTIVAMLCAGGAWLLSYPRLWRWCLYRLDMRNWAYSAWLAIAIVLFIILTAMRLWPERRREKMTTSVSEASEDGQEAVAAEVTSP